MKYRFVKGMMGVVDTMRGVGKLVRGAGRWRGVRGAVLMGSVMIAVMLVTPTWAWGPEREQLFTMESPAPYVTFNSITNNPVLGDERDFVRIMEVGAGKDFANQVELVPGRMYEVYAGYHNNASANLNASGKGIARGTKMTGLLPRLIKKGEKKAVSVTISAENARPKSVWDEAYMIAKEQVTLKYVADSATIHTKAKLKDGSTSDGMRLLGLLTPEGTELGLRMHAKKAGKLDGFLPGCAEWSGYVTFRFVAEGTPAPAPAPVPNPKPSPEPSADPKGEGELVKEVGREGKFGEEIEAKEGEVVDFRVKIKNVGKGSLKNLELMDKMAKGMELVKGSVKVAYEDGKVVREKDFDNFVGFTVSELGAGKNMEINYKVKVGKVACGENKLENTFVLKVEGKEVKDGAVVKVEKECENVEEEPKPKPAPEPTPVVPTPPAGKIPETGPAEVALVVVVLLGIGGGAWYFVRTKKALEKKKREVGLGGGVGGVGDVGDVVGDGAGSAISDGVRGVADGGVASGVTGDGLGSGTGVGGGVEGVDGGEVGGNDAGGVGGNDVG